MKQNFFYILLVAVFFNSYTCFGQSTSLVKDLNPGTGDGFDQWNNQGIQFKDYYILPSQNSDDNLELYAIKNGEISLIKDINPTGSSKPDNFVLFNNKIYFIAESAANGREIWSTDGTPEGTMLTIDILPGLNSGNPDKLFVSKNGKLYFSALKKLYISDGTTTGTKEITGLNEVDLKGDEGMVSAAITSYKNGVAFVNKNYKVYQVYYHDGISLTKLHELTGTSFTDVYGLSEISNGLLFAVNDSFTESVNGIFTIDKLSSTVTKLLDKENKPFYSYRLIKFNDQQSIFKTLNAMYVTDGSNLGTIKLTEAPFTLSQGEKLSHNVINGKMIFRGGYSNVSDHVYITDGTEAGTKKIAQCNVFLSPIISFGNKAYWFAGTSNGFDAELWEADMSTSLAKRIYKKTPNRNPSPTAIPLCMQNNILYFNSTLYGDGRELYKFNLDLNGVMESTNDNIYRLTQSMENVFAVYTNEPEDISITHYDLTGRILTKLNTGDSKDFELNMPAGVTMLEVKGKTSRNIFKIYKK